MSKPKPCGDSECYACGRGVPAKCPQMPESPWRSVKDEPPERHVHVFIATGSNRGVGWRDLGEYWVSRHSNPFLIDAPDYWMPIPPLPEGER